jgi:hypothetical protein
MEVATGDEELKSLLQNFNRVSQVLDTTSRAASPLLPGSSYTTAARLRTAFAVHPRSVSVWFRMIALRAVLACSDHRCGSFSC